MSPQLMKNGPPCAKYECSPKGWINENIFVDWLKHFIYHSKSSLDNVVLLILDNHNSHATLESYELCRKNGVIMLSLPPHCSHRMQPLDVTFYSTLKAAFKREWDLHIKTCHLLRITPYDLAELFNRAYSKVATIAVAVSGFKATGIQPFDSTIFTDVDFLAADEFINQSNISLPQIENDEPGQHPAAIYSANVQTDQASEPHESDRQQEESRSAVGSLNQNSQQTADLTFAVTFEDLIPLPGPSRSQGKFSQREKQKSEILTSSPKRKDLELKIEKRKLKELKKQNAIFKKQSKNLLSQLDLPASTKKPKQKSQLNKVQKKKCKPRKKKAFEETDSSEGDEPDVDMEDLCDDDELDDLPGTDDQSTCFICEEFGRDGEEWYRCSTCAIWIHALYSAADSPEGFQCDRCVKK